MGAIAKVIKKASRPTRVTRRGEGARDDAGRFTPAPPVVAIVSMAIQPGAGRDATTLARIRDGDSTAGKIRVWVRRTAVEAAYLEGDVNKVPIGWSSLRVASPEYAEGPPGDRVEWQGREYELTEEQDRDDAGLITDSPFRRYIATERGAA